MSIKPFQIGKFQNILQTRHFGRPLWYFRSLDSTSTHLKKKPPQNLPEGLVCIADHQQEGRGQYKRAWFSEPFANLMFTVILKPHDTGRLQILPLLAGCSVLKAVEEVTGLSLMMKWPNDIVLASEKLGGILAESVFTGSRIDRLLVGIGLNVNQQLFESPDLVNATSISKLAGGPVDREELLCKILLELENNYALWEQGDIQIIRYINRHIIGYGQWCPIEINGNRMADPHKILGIDPRGFLLTLNADDIVKTFTHEQVRIFCD
jgi:BirA family transcriptional regulator, biotin operon repressor / biotin---[acetyl-CoA-carboxylase] ligase